MVNEQWCATLFRYSLNDPVICTGRLWSNPYFMLKIPSCDMQENGTFSKNVMIKFEIEPAHFTTTTYRTFRKSTWFLGPLTFIIQSLIRTLLPGLLKGLCRREDLNSEVLRSQHIFCSLSGLTVDLWPSSIPLKETSVKCLGLCQSFRHLCARSEMVRPPPLTA